MLPSVVPILPRVKLLNTFSMKAIYNIKFRLVVAGTTNRQSHGIIFALWWRRAIVQFDWNSWLCDCSRYVVDTENRKLPSPYSKSCN